jgi:hypothetical protein
MDGASSIVLSPFTALGNRSVFYHLVWLNPTLGKARGRQARRTDNRFDAQIRRNSQPGNPVQKPRFSLTVKDSNRNSDQSKKGRNLPPSTTRDIIRSRIREEKVMLWSL